MSTHEVEDAKVVKRSCTIGSVGWRNALAPLKILVWRLVMMLPFQKCEKPGAMAG